MPHLGAARDMPRRARDVPHRLTGRGFVAGVSAVVYAA